MLGTMERRRAHATFSTARSGPRDDRPGGPIRARVGDDVMTRHTGDLIGSPPSRWGGQRIRAQAERLIFSGEGLTDDMLLAGFGARDPVVSPAFVLRFQRAVFGAAFAVIGERGLAEDAAQESFVRALVHRERYDPSQGTVRSWLMTIARNSAVDAVRVRRAGPVDQQHLELLVTAIVEGPEPHALSHDTAGWLRRALAELPAAQARAAMLTAVHGFTAAELAEREMIPLGSAKSRIRAAMSKLHATVPDSGDL
jgi:RNA polymerase sigma factor (sigma-70 family)